MVDVFAVREANHLVKDSAALDAKLEEVLKQIDRCAPLANALTKAVEETADVTHFVMVGLVRLIEGRISLKALSGPITIY